MPSKAHAIAAEPLALPQYGFLIEELQNLGDPTVRAKLSPAARKAFFRIMEAWQVPVAQARVLLGGISTGTYFALKADRPQRAFDQDLLTRISLLLGIYKALAVLYSRQLAHQWMLRPNSNAMFGGSAPLDYILRGGVPGMMYVRQLLDSRAGGR